MPWSIELIEKYDEDAQLKIEIKATKETIIIEDNGDLTDWFQDSNGGYPNYVVIDHGYGYQVQY